MTQRDEYRALYLSYLKYCNEHDFDRMASFYTSTIKVNDVPMDPADVTAQFALAEQGNSREVGQLPLLQK